MSDDTDRIMGAIAGLRSDTMTTIASLRGDMMARMDRLQDTITAVRSETMATIASLRGDMMARIDRLQDMVTAIRDDITVNMGAVEHMKTVNDNTREGLRTLEGQVSVMWRQLKTLEGKVRGITGDP